MPLAALSSAALSLPLSSVLQPEVVSHHQVLSENQRLKERISELQSHLDTTRSLTHRRSNRERMAAAMDADAAVDSDAAPEPSDPLGSSAPGAYASTEFTKERFLATVPESTNGARQLLLTFTNGARLDFALNWARHVQAIGLDGWFIGATDSDALTHLLTEGIPTFRINTTLPEGEWGWGSPSFHALGPHKVHMVQQTLRWGFEVIVTDTDALVLRDPWAYMARWPDAGFLTTSDHLWNTTSDGGLEDHRGIHSAFNIGYMFFRKSALPLVEVWLESVLSNPVTKWDQGEFNALARQGWDPVNTKGLSDPRLFWSYKQRVIGGVLPLSLFCGGHNYFVSQFPQRMGWKPYSIHTTFQYGGAHGKRHRLREAMVWIDPPSYYDPSGGVLHYTPDVPEKLLRPSGGMTTAAHIRLVEHQLKQLANGFALAQLLGRVLVLPPLICGYDKYWGSLSEDGMIPGGPKFAAPIFHCPLDHVLEPYALHLDVTGRECVAYASRHRTSRL